MTTGIMRPPLLVGFLFLEKGEITMKEGIIHDMKYYPVSTFVNSVKNNDPNCIKPIEL
jgi:putative SOS response-associated peptidase YedK